MADVKIIDIDNEQWNIKDQTARDSISALKTQLATDNTYSTSEVKTSKKWINGKPIYRKVVETGSLPNNSQVGYNHNIANAEFFITIRGIAKSTSLFLPIPFVERNGSTNIQLYASANSFTVSTNYNASSYNGTFIFEYTKTTD